MSKVDIIRAWKDAEYRQGMSAKDLALLPEHPAGAIELTDEELPLGVGAISGEDCWSFVVCLPPTFINGCPFPPITG